MVVKLLESGRKVLIRQAESNLEHLKKIKALDWKVNTFQWLRDKTNIKPGVPKRTLDMRYALNICQVKGKQWPETGALPPILIKVFVVGLKHIVSYRLIIPFAIWIGRQR